jgi:hypothetical protein
MLSRSGFSGSAKVRQRTRVARDDPDPLGWAVLMRLIVLATVLLATIGCSDVPLLGPCPLGASAKCPAAVEIARQALKPDWDVDPRTIIDTRIEETGGCDQVIEIPAGLRCPDDLVYGAKVIFTVRRQAQPVTVWVAEWRGFPLQAWAANGVPE